MALAVFVSAAMGAFTAVAPATLRAQATGATAGDAVAATNTAPRTIQACYIPNSGLLYLILEPNAPTACLGNERHLKFTWTDGLPGNQHGALNGLIEDDHPQYLLVDPATRALIANLNAAGFKVTGLAAASAAGEAVVYEQAVKTGDAAGGDLGGTYPDPLVIKLQGQPLASTAPATGQVLVWDGTQWAPATPASGVSDHGALNGLADDDHTQYVLADGVRSTTNGFAVTGTFGAGTIPVSGTGVRMMWYPGSAAFRAGSTVGAGWTDASIGAHSVAMGEQTVASGNHSVAMGEKSVASGSHSFAVGHMATASGFSAVAMGQNTTAGSQASVALGFNATTEATDGQHKNGVFVFSDLRFAEDRVRPTEANQFVVRAGRGLRLFNSIGVGVTNSLFTFEDGGTGTGCRILDGNLTCTGAINSSSDASLKTGFEPVDAEQVLTTLAAVPVQKWSYRADGADVRHVGPTAQDFRAAFGLGQDDRTISAVDADGINMLAIQALEQRTRELRQRVAELEELRAAFATLQSDHHALVGRLEKLEAAVRQLVPLER